MEQEQDKDQPKTDGPRVTFRRLECPFDLEQILQMSYSTSGLKSVLEFVMDHVGENQAKLAETKEEIQVQKQETEEKVVN